MKIFLTGSSGFIGSNIASFFKKETVFCYRRGDSLLTQLDSFRPDWIINCAAEIYDQSKMWSSNVLIVKDCLDWIVENPNTCMIQLGSSSEYGPVDRPTSEKDSISATDMYGTTKGIATSLCKSYCQTHDLDVVVIRPYSPFGPGESARRLFPKLWQSFKHNRPMNLVNGVHDFCYIDDFVNAVYNVMSSNKRIRGDIINISSGVQTSNFEVLECFRSITGLFGAVTLIDKFCTPKVWQADISHAREHYGWKPTISLDKGISLFWEKSYYE